MKSLFRKISKYIKQTFTQIKSKLTSQKKIEKLTRDEFLMNRKEKLSHLQNRYQLDIYVIEQHPKVVEGIERTNLEIDILENMPSSWVDKYLIPSMPVNQDLALTKSNFPLSFDPLQQISPSTDTFTTSSSALVFHGFPSLDELNNPYESEYMTKVTEDYLIFQERYNKSDEIRRMLSSLPKGEETIERFNRAEKAYKNFKGGIGERTSAASEMRTYLWGVNGCLEEGAKDWKNENRPSWEKMAQRYVGGPEYRKEYLQFLDEKRINEELVRELSEILKDREKEREIDINSIWIKLLDHSIVLLSITKIKRFT